MGRILAANRRNYECYRQHLHGLAGLSLIHYDPAEKHNYHYVVVEVEAGAAGLTRDELVRVLQAENVLARRYFWPGCHRLEPYRSAPPPGGWRLPATERLAARLMVLPTGTGLGLPDIRRVCDLIRAALAQAPRIRRALPGASAAKTGPDPRRSSG
jgi:dTDP-4-amino-4,6-dideoxygalactose transaminase